MASVKGRNEVRQFIAAVPEQIEKVLRGAGRAAARVIADEARERCISAQVRDDIKVKTKVEDGVSIIAKVVVQGKSSFIAPWLEYGTAPHFISVDDSQRGGLSVRKVNEKLKGGSLVIGGAYVGSTVFHPGATPHPFMRPALDTKEAEARAAAQNFINARVSRSGINTSNDDGGGDA